MKQILLLILSVFFANIDAMDRPERYNGLVFLAFDNKTGKDWEIDFLSEGKAKIEKYSKRFVTHAAPMGSGEFIINFQEPEAFTLDAPLSLFVRRFNFGAIDFALAPRKLKNIEQRLTFDPNAKNDVYLATITLMGDNLEKSSFEVTQIKNKKFVELLKRHKSHINGREYEESRPLIAALFDSLHFTTQELREIVPFLIKAGADLNAQKRGGATALAIIASSERRDLLGIARRLLEAGANPNIPTGDGSTPLLLALTLKNRDIAKVLIENGADVNMKNVSDDFPLNIAIFEREPELAKLLIAKGVKINHQSVRTGATPLHNAVLEGYPEMVKLLLDAGADYTIRNINGNTPIGVAKNLLEQGVDRKSIMGLLSKAIEDRQKKYAQEWKARVRIQP